MRAISSRALRDADSSPSDFDVFRNRFASRRQSGVELLLLAGIALCLLLMFTVDSKPVAAVSQASFAGKFSGLGEQWRNLRGKYDWDFQTGMDSWINPREPLSDGTRWRATGGSVRPAELRVWRDTGKLVDYRLEFSGRIQSRGLNWAYRVVDGRNYYAAKLALSGPPVARRGELVRYAVVNGREGVRVRVAVPIEVTAERTYQVRTDVKGDDFTTFLDGKLIDHWSDNRLAQGGIGFFAEKGEVADIYQVNVSAQSELLRRLLAHAGFFAPQIP